MTNKFITMKVRVEDKKKLMKKKLHETEPLWSVVKRILQEPQV